MTTAVATQPDWPRTLLTPLRAPAWRIYLYIVLVVSAIFTKLDLPPSQAQHRRVLAVVTYLNS